MGNRFEPKPEHCIPKSLRTTVKVIPLLKRSYTYNPHILTQFVTSKFSIDRRSGGFLLSFFNTHSLSIFLSVSCVIIDRMAQLSNVYALHLTIIIHYLNLNMRCMFLFPKWVVSMTCSKDDVLCWAGEGWWQNWVCSCVSFPWRISRPAC